MTTKPNKLADVADALDCFWNAAIGHAQHNDDPTALAVTCSLAEGFAAVSARLKEHAAREQGNDHPKGSEARVVASLPGEVEELRALVRGFLDCAEIADIDSSDMDADTVELERRARRYLARLSPTVVDDSASKEEGPAWRTAMPPAELLRLAEKVEGAKGADRDLDSRVIQACSPGIGEPSPHCVGDEPIFWNDPFYKMRVPRLTSSLDAVTALIREKLPEWGYQITVGPAGHLIRSARLIAPPEAPDAPITDGRSWSRHFEGAAKDETCALLSALLRALATQEKKHGG